MARDMKIYFLYSKDGTKYIDTALGGKELARILKRTYESVKSSLNRIKYKKEKIIRNKEGISFMVITEDDLRGVPTKRRKHER